jgi:hypothetical protein
MPEPILHKYFDFGGRATADLTLGSGEHVFLSIIPSGFAAHRTHLRGFLPGRRLFGIESDGIARLARVIARSADMLPSLPTAQQHRDKSATTEFPDTAGTDLAAITGKRPSLGLVDALELDNRPERPLALFTRLAFAAADTTELARRFERASNTPG